MKSKKYNKLVNMTEKKDSQIERTNQWLPMERWGGGI